MKNFFVYTTGKLCRQVWGSTREISRKIFPSKAGGPKVKVKNLPNVLVLSMWNTADCKAFLGDSASFLVQFVPLAAKKDKPGQAGAGEKPKLSLLYRHFFSLATYDTYG